MLCQQAGVQEAGREHGQDSWPELAKGISHTMERHAQYVRHDQEHTLAEGGEECTEDDLFQGTADCKW